MELMQHQKDAVEKLHNGSILYGGVGSGKSMTAAAYYMKAEAPKNVYVITTAKKRDSLDWEGVFVSFGIGTDLGGTIAGILVVDSWNNIGNYIEAEDAFFIFDEQRLVGSGAWVKAFLKIVRNNNWIMLTATPGDVWMDYAPVFIANNLYKNRTEFIREHVVFKPFAKYPTISRYLDTRTLEKYRNMLLVEMPYLSKNVRVVEDIVTAHDVDLFKRAVTDRWNVYEDRPIKDVAELFRVMRRIVNSDPSRVEELKRLLTKHPKIVVFYNFDYELEILRGMASEVTIAEWNGHRKEPIPNTESWLYLVQYVAGAEGWNCTETDTMVFYSLTYSWKNFVQAQGRIDRLNNRYHVLQYFVFLSDSIIDRAVRKSLGSKKLFNERQFAAKNMGILDQK